MDTEPQSRDMPRWPVGPSAPQVQNALFAALNCMDSRDAAREVFHALQFSGNGHMPTNVRDIFGAYTEKFLRKGHIAAARIVHRIATGQELSESLFNDAIEELAKDAKERLEMDPANIALLRQNKAREFSAALTELHIRDS